MKKILVLIMVLFLASCALGPGEASSRSIEDIQVTVSPPAANFKVELYSQNVLMGTTATNSKGIATFSNLPVGAYKAVVLNPTGVKATDKYFTSVYVSGPTSFKVFVNVPAFVPPVVPPSTIATSPTIVTPTPTQFCSPNSVLCSGDFAKVLSCNSAGTAVTTTACIAPTPWCVVEPVYTKCVECRFDADCPAGKYCTSGHVCVPLVCTPNQITCKTANTKSVCNAAGTALADTVCTGNADMCVAGKGCVECATNADCASGTCQNNVCVTAPSACIRCKTWASPSTCEWVYKGLCEYQGKGNYPVCNTFTFYPQYVSSPCYAVNPYATLGGPSGIGGTIPIGGQQINLYKAYECCDKTITTAPPSPIVVAHCGNNIKETNLGEQCEKDLDCPVGQTCIPPGKQGECTCFGQPVSVHCPNGKVEPELGEECEPPNTPTCDSTCHYIPESEIHVSSVDTAALIQCYSPGYQGGHLTWFSRGYAGCSGVPLETSLGFLLTRISNGIKAADVAEIAVCQHTYGGSGTSYLYTYSENEIAYDGVPCSPETRVSEYSEPVRREFVGYAFKNFVPGTKLAYKCAKLGVKFNFRVSFDSKCHTEDDYYTTNIWGVRTYHWNDYVNVGTLGYWPMKSSLP